MRTACALSAAAIAALASCGASQGDELASSVRTSYQRVEDENGSGGKVLEAECTEQGSDRWRCKVTAQRGDSAPKIDRVYAVAFETNKCWAGRVTGTEESSGGRLLAQGSITPRAPLELLRGCL